MLDFNKLKSDLLDYKYSKGYYTKELAVKSGIAQNCLSGLLTAKSAKGVHANTYIKLCKLMNKDLNEYVI